MIAAYWRTLMEQAYPIWVAGGWAMYPLAFNALVLFGLGTLILLRLIRSGARGNPDAIWNRWMDNPRTVRGPVGDIIRHAMRCRSLSEMQAYFSVLGNEELAPFARDLGALRVCVGAAPLLGLLGTVTGMLTTFDALATGGGGEKTMTRVAGGISEALITTEAGLVIALVGLIFQFSLMRQHERYTRLINHIETLCMQTMHKQNGPRQA